MVLASKKEVGVLRKQKLNMYNVLVLVVLGLGSLTYGYTASIIGTTLGKWLRALQPVALLLILYQVNLLLFGIWNLTQDPTEPICSQA